MQVEETTPTTPLRPTRAGFVRGLPLTMPIEEVIERGREAGIELQPSDIHAARYYMRQAAAAEGSSIPQQLMLGGTFVTKREPARGNGAAKSGDSASAAGDQSQPSTLLSDAASADVEPGTGSGRSTRRGRAQTGARTASRTESRTESRAESRPGSKAGSRAESKSGSHAKTRGRVGSAKAGGVQESLHNRLQSRLRNATFRDTAREGVARAKADKATIGKALDGAAKARGKRGLKSDAALEEELRTIALRVGTQRVRELLDEMEALALRA